jgi:citrate lyase subunit gamma (acyl carrier protein)
MSQSRIGQAGTIESNDIMITLVPGPQGSGITIELESIVLAQYGEAIRQVIASVLSDRAVTDMHVRAVDRGALDCTIRARMLAALSRAGITPKGGKV